MMNSSMITIFKHSVSLRTAAMVCLLWATTPLHAEPMGELDVTAAVETFLRGVITDARADATVERMEPHVVAGETVAYIVHLAGGGFCLSGADDLVLPVYFYAPEGTYDGNNPNLQYILWEIAERTRGSREALSENDPALKLFGKALRQRASDWMDLTARRIPLRIQKRSARAEPDKMILPLTSEWGQGSPYNDQCPALPGHPNRPPPWRLNVRVGCVATAMAQIMYYWKWPNTGNSSYQYTWAYATFEDWESTPLQTDPGISTGKWSGRLEWDNAAAPAELRMGGNWDPSVYSEAVDISDDADYRVALAALWGRKLWIWTFEFADFGAATYDWDLMHDVHADGDGVPDSEVAELSRHASVAVGMAYGLYVSTSSTADSRNAFVNKFRYDAAAIYGIRNTDWMTNEIQWLRPFVLKGKKPAVTVGHAWVVYGYDKATDPARLFLMNFGWDGRSNGWYACDDVNIGYTTEQKHVSLIAPKDVVKFVGGVADGDGAPDEPYEDVTVAVDSAPNGATLIFQAGSTNTFPGGSLVIVRPLTLKAQGAAIVLE